MIMLYLFLVCFAVPFQIMDNDLFGEEHRIRLVLLEADMCKYTTGLYEDSFSYLAQLDLPSFILPLSI